MTHPDGFWQDILEHPADDEPRLRYADWLDYRCDPLGEFIRVQCRLARLAPHQENVLELERREQELLAEFEDAWAGELAHLSQWWVFRRGFVEEVSCTADQFLAAGEEVFERGPVQEVHLHHLRHRMEQLAFCPSLRKPRLLDLSGNHLRDQGVRLLAQSPHLDDVVGLNLGSNSLGDAGLRALAAGSRLGGLRELYLCDNRITDAGAQALVESPLALRLEILHLRFNPIGPEGAALLRRHFANRLHL